MTYFLDPVRDLRRPNAQECWPKKAVLAQRVFQAQPVFVSRYPTRSYFEVLCTYYESSISFTLVWAKDAWKTSLKTAL